MNSSIRREFNSISNAIKQHTNLSDSILIPLYQELYKQVMAELLHQNLMSEIRGEKWVAYSKRHNDSYCLNCYAFQDMIEMNGIYGIEGVFCENHLNDFERDIYYLDSIITPGNTELRKLSYLEFINETCWICPDSIFTYDRLGINFYSHHSCYKGDIDNFDNKFRMVLDLPPSEVN